MSNDSALNAQSSKSNSVRRELAGIRNMFLEQSPSKPFVLCTAVNKEQSIRKFAFLKEAEQQEKKQAEARERKEKRKEETYSSRKRARKSDPEDGISGH